MLRSVLCVSIIFSVLMVSGLSTAQDVPQGKWWKNKKVADRLQLGSEEIQQLDDAFFESRRNLIPLKSNVEKERLELEILAGQMEINSEALLDQYKRVEEARSQLGIERFRFFIKIREIVGYDRFQKLLAVKKARKNKKEKAGK